MLLYFEIYCQILIVIICNINNDNDVWFEDVLFMHIVVEECGVVVGCVYVHKLVVHKLVAIVIVKFPFHHRLI